MENYVEKEIYEVPFARKSNQKADLVLENAHYFGDYEASNNGEVIIGTLKINDKVLYHLVGDEEFTAEELARYAIEWSGSSQAKDIIAKYEVAQSWIREGEKDDLVKSTEQYLESKKLSENLKDDYAEITNTLIYMPYLNTFLQNCKKERDVEKLQNSALHGYLSMEDRDSFKNQFRFIYEKEPTDEQLDMFIKFMFGLETDVDKVRAVCDANIEQAQPLSE